RLRNGRVNHSRVAAQTGLTRAEVRKLLASNIQLDTRARSDTPMERVLAGWRRDPYFSGRAMGPNPIRIAGRARSFTNLAKKYAGDVPYRAVLKELERSGAVSVRNGRVSLRAPVREVKSEDFRLITLLAPSLIDSLRTSSSASV